VQLQPGHAPQAQPRRGVTRGGAMNLNHRNNALTVIRVVVWIFMIGAAAISTRHIVHVSQMLGLGWESYTVPAFVDGIAVVGKASMLPRFSQRFRRSGFRLLMFGGLLSLAANVAAGSNWGQRAFGVLVVAGFMLLESHATKADRTAIAPAPVVEVDDALKAKRSAAARKGAVTKARNKAQAARKPKAPAKVSARKLAEIEAEFAMAAAPVSPAS
jgi:hypothetical protein